MSIARRSMSACLGWNLSRMCVGVQKFASLYFRLQRERGDAGAEPVLLRTSLQARPRSANPPQKSDGVALSVCARQCDQTARNEIPKPGSPS